MTTGCDPSLVLVVASLEQMSAAGGIGRALVHRALADDALLERLNREATGCAFLERLHARLMLEYLEGLEAKRVDGRLGWAPLFEAANVVRASHPHGMGDSGEVVYAQLMVELLTQCVLQRCGEMASGGQYEALAMTPLEELVQEVESESGAAAVRKRLHELQQLQVHLRHLGDDVQTGASERVAERQALLTAEALKPVLLEQYPHWVMNWALTRYRRCVAEWLGAPLLSRLVQEARSPMLQALGIVEGAERTATHNETTETAVETPVLSVTKPARKVAAGAKAAGKRARRRTAAAQCAAPTEDVDVSPNKRPCVRRTTAARSPKTRAANVDTVSSSSSSDDQRPEASRGNRRAGGGLMRRLLQPSAVAADRSDLWHEDANVGGIAQTPTAKTAAAPPRRVRAAVNVPDAVPSPEPSPASTVRGSESARKRHFCRYSSAEDAALLEGLQQCGIGHWKLILQRIGSRLHPSHRSTSSLRDRVRQLGWRREDFPIPNALLDEIRSGGEINALGRVRFTAVEDEALRRGLQHYGWGAWKTILQHGAFHPRRNWRALKDRARHLQRSMPGFPLMADGVNAS
ncbi:hypothetical protein CDCA_CDCA11G3124 [Cyanidium caldarium]|uniref:Myb-like domain-containing protein n=1 Tax=Cyanidium caldarium TaxID=2771 RepID=A0AAV9IXT4_CYACA|nr:hypothetical protein CDCA_CDCA11G3124 [Cyanidium caldarium]